MRVGKEDVVQAVCNLAEADDEDESPPGERPQNGLAADADSADIEPASDDLEPEADESDED